jgi:hypothetical protein
VIFVAPIVYGLVDLNEVVTVTVNVTVTVTVTVTIVVKGVKVERFGFDEL